MLPYMVAFMEDDGPAMQRHLDWFSGRADEYLALDLLTGSAAFRGQWRKAQDHSRKSVELAMRNGAKEVAAQFAADQAVRIAFWRSGTMALRITSYNVCYTKLLRSVPAVRPRTLP